MNVLRLYEDVLGDGASSSLSPAVRAVYVAEGMASFRAAGGAATLSANSAWHGAGGVEISARNGARLLRYELVAAQAGKAAATGDGISSSCKISANIELQPGEAYLMRCDRVDIPPGGVAYTHVHAGPGIRCLLEGELTVETGGKIRRILPGQSWFESGPEPVLAYATDDRPGDFCRVMILPRTYRGRSSITYLRDEDRNKPRRQKYTVFLDEFI